MISAGAAVSVRCSGSCATVRAHARAAASRSPHHRSPVDRRTSAHAAASPLRPCALERHASKRDGARAVRRRVSLDRGGLDKLAAGAGLDKLLIDVDQLLVDVNTLIVDGHGAIRPPDTVRPSRIAPIRAHAHPDAAAGPLRFLPPRFPPVSHGAAEHFEPPRDMALRLARDSPTAAGKLARGSPTRELLARDPYLPTRDAHLPTRDPHLPTRDAHYLLTVEAREIRRGAARLGEIRRGEARVSEIRRGAAVRGRGAPRPIVAAPSRRRTAGEVRQILAGLSESRRLSRRFMPAVEAAEAEAVATREVQSVGENDARPRGTTHSVVSSSPPSTWHQLGPSDARPRGTSAVRPSPPARKPPPASRVTSQARQQPPQQHHRRRQQRRRRRQQHLARLIADDTVGQRRFG